MPDTKEIALFIAIIVLAILFLIAIIAFSMVSSRRKLLEAEKQKQRELIRVVVETKQTQATKIATELHNLIIPTLILAALNLNKELSKLQKGSADFSTLKEEIEKLAQIAESIREIAHGIIPKMFTSFGVVKSIETAVKHLGSVENRTAVFENHTDYKGDLPYPMVYQITIYNACLEILNNLRKHSNYKGLTVNLENSDDFFIFVFTHDGIGITNEEVKKLAEVRKGIGLISLQSLAIALEGDIDYRKEVGVSTITLKFPIKYESID